MDKRVDVLVIGTGAAGLSYALKVADYCNVLVVTKSDVMTTNTNKAQGGICSVTYDPDTFEQHIQDTMVCGSNKGNEKAVELVVRNAPSQIKELIRWGVKFDKTGGKYDLAREGGHTQYRILHHKDNTGNEIQRALTTQAKRHKNIEIMEHHLALDLLTQHHLGELVKKSTPGIECYGAYIFDILNQNVFTVLSKVTVIATGGVGNVYHTTTNPAVATGDGIAMVHRAKGLTENMEFIQFHPTALYNPGERPCFLISEALRGFGGILKTQDHKEFMHKYHPMGSLAPRDIVARSIDTELKFRGEDFVYLDVTHRPASDIINHFPNIYQKCLSIDIDITKDMIPVAPAAHYSCGGVKVDLNGETSIKHLYAIGEASSTGLHGANRLASNSLIEAVVYADIAAKHTLSSVNEVSFKEGIPSWDYEGTAVPEELVLITQSYRELQQIMSNYVGIVRSNVRLERAFRRLEIIYQETEELYKVTTLSQHLIELRNMITVAYLIIKQAQQMKLSVGLHYSLDYPNRFDTSEF